MTTPNEKRVHLLGIGILAMVNIVNTPVPENTGFGAGLLGYLALVILIAVQWLAIVWQVKRAWRQYPGLDQVKPRLLYSFLYSIVLATPLMLLTHFTIEKLMGYPGTEWSPGFLLSYFVNAFILCFTGIGATEAVYYYTRLRQAEQEKEELMRINLLAQYDSLKQQVNPHFLFNSLNSLSSLIQIDPVKAEKFVEELSHVYRYLLQNSREELTPLHRELGFIRSYLHLLKTRFGDAFVVKLEVPEISMRWYIPPLTLQLLIENAVKHNEVSSENPLYLDIVVVDGAWLKVANNLQKKTGAIPSEKVGLANIMAKYRLLGQSEVQVHDTGSEFIVMLPLIKHP